MAPCLSSFLIPQVIPPLCKMIDMSSSRRRAACTVSPKQSPTPPHRFWNIPELVDMVAQKLEDETERYHFALTSKFNYGITMRYHWCDPDESQLWAMCGPMLDAAESVEGPSPFPNSLPPQQHWHFRKCDWDRLIAHCSCIRTLSVPQASPYDPDPSRLSLIFFQSVLDCARCYGTEVFPSLRHLEFDMDTADSIEMELFQRLLQSSLESIAFPIPWFRKNRHTDFHDTAQSLAAILPAVLASRCPQLTELTLLDGPLDLDSQLLALRSYIRALPNLRTLTLGPSQNPEFVSSCAFHPALLREAAAIRGLEHLSISLAEGYFEPARIHCPPNERLDFSFNTLKSLHVRSLGANLIATAIRACVSPLQNLKLELGWCRSCETKKPHDGFHMHALHDSREFQLGDCISSVISAICENPHTSHVQELELRFTHPLCAGPSERDENVPWALFVPLLRHCPHVRSFKLDLYMERIDEQRGLEMDDSELASLSSAWPELRHLSLTWLPMSPPSTWPRYWGSGPTFYGGLLALATFKQLQTAHFTCLRPGGHMPERLPRPSRALRRLSLLTRMEGHPSRGLALVFFRGLFPAARMEGLTDVLELEDFGPFVEAEHPYLMIYCA